MTVALSVDVEPDFPPHYDTFKGKEGLKYIVDALKEKECSATFFVCAELFDQHPDLIDTLRGFEIGCHGLRHVNLTSLSQFQIEAEIAEASEVFNEHKIKAYGFRAPYCKVNYTVLSAVKKYFEYDSSMQFYSFGRMPGLAEAPVFIGGKAFGINPILFKALTKTPLQKKVYFTHPWEYGGMDFQRIMEKRQRMKKWGYKQENYKKNLEALLTEKTVAVKDVI